MTTVKGFQTGKRYKFNSVQEGKNPLTEYLGDVKQAWQIEMDKPLRSGDDWANYHVLAEQKAKEYIRQKYSLPKGTTLYADCRLDRPFIDVWIPKR